MVDWATALPIIIGIMGLAGVVFTALRFGRDDTTAVVTQQAQITAEMQTLNIELRATADRLRDERDDSRLDVEKLTGQVEELRLQLGDRH